jgi:predicted aldo/keto reductase-like oxidoreductase
MGSELTPRGDTLLAPAGRLGLWPRLGFGVAGPLAGPLVAQEDALTLIMAAVRGGAGYLDTAPAYGEGEAECRVGLALRRLAVAGEPTPLLSTKAGLSSRPGGRRIRDFRPEAILRSVEASLARLGVGAVDLLLLHGPDPRELTDPLLATLAALQAEGRVRHLGVACRGPEAAVMANSGVFDALMLPLPPDREPALHEIAAAAGTTGHAVIGIEVMTAARGLARLSPGGIYRLFRRLARGGAAPLSTGPTPEEALRHALSAGPAHTVLTTTTRLQHLAANLTIAREVVAQRRAVT